LDALLPVANTSTVRPVALPMDVPGSESTSVKLGAS
jgi:hypothetical protein